MVEKNSPTFTPKMGNLHEEKKVKEEIHKQFSQSDLLKEPFSDVIVVKELSPYFKAVKMILDAEDPKSVPTLKPSPNKK
ncbi:MAG: hypothetical protein ACHQJ6_00750 [Candidatus Berkiellales bacterium]